MSEPKLGQVNLITRDFDASLRFYRVLGFDIPDAIEQPPGVFHVSRGGLDLDNRFLGEMYSGDDTPRVVIGISVASREAVDETYARVIAAGYRSRKAPHDAFWGARYAMVIDPDGNDVGIMSPRDR